MKTIATTLFKSHLDPGEKILAVCHRHFFILIPELMRISFFGFLIPIGLWYLFPEFGIVFLIWISISIGRLFYAVSNWYHDSLLLTNVSLIRVGWNGFFHRTSTRLEYTTIDGLSYAVKGFLKTIFNYGDVTIARTGGATAFTLHDAVNPSKVERLVLHYQETFVSDQSLKDADSLKNLLTTMLRHHAKTQGGTRLESKE